jgi:hypothetical protein
MESFLQKTEVLKFHKITKKKLSYKSFLKLTCAATTNCNKETNKQIDRQTDKCPLLKLTGAADTKSLGTASR